MSDSDRPTESVRERDDRETPSPETVGRDEVRTDTTVSAGRDEDRTAARDEDRTEAREEDRTEARQQDPINLYIRGVAPQATDKEMADAFDHFGKVVSCSVVRDPYSRECRGFAFVKMATMESAEAAMNVSNGITVCGRKLSVERARRNGPHPKTPGQYLGVDRSVREKFGNKRRFDDRGGPDYGRDPYPRRPSGYEEERFQSRRRMSPPRRPYTPDRGYNARGSGRDHFEPRGEYGRDRRFENHSASYDNPTGRRQGPPDQGPPEPEHRRDGPPVGNFRQNEIAASGRDDFGRDRR